MKRRVICTSGSIFYNIEVTFVDFATTIGDLSKQCVVNLLCILQYVYFTPLESPGKTRRVRSQIFSSIVESLRNRKRMKDLLVSKWGVEQRNQYPRHSRKSAVSFLVQVLHHGFRRL